MKGFKLKMKSELYSSLVNFLKKAETLYITPNEWRTITVVNKNENKWTRICKQFHNWNSLINNQSVKKSIFSLKEFNTCIDIIDKVLVPRNIITSDYDSLRKENRRFNQSELYFLFLKYNELKEINSKVNLEDFCKNTVESIFTKNVTIFFRALLIGFDSKDSDCFKINDFKILKLSDYEKLEMINNYDKKYLIDDPYLIAAGYIDTMPYDFWISGKFKYEYNETRDSIFLRKPKNKIKELEKNIEKFLLAFRLGKNIEIGIRDYYIKISYTGENEIYYKWHREDYKFRDFHLPVKNFSGSYKIKNYHTPIRHITNSDVDLINKTYDLIIEYLSNPLDQISQALFYFNSSFEKNNIIYIFTDLIMSLETLLNDPNNIKNITKEKILEQLENIKKNVTI